MRPTGLSPGPIRAAVWNGPDSPLQVRELAIRAPGPGQVRVEIVACAICQSDLSFIDGHWGSDAPAVFGHEAAGIVRELGAGTDPSLAARLAVGDPVAISLIRSCGECDNCQNGLSVCCTAHVEHDTPLFDGPTPIAQGLDVAAFATEVVVDASQVVRIPDTMPMEHASLLGCGVVTGAGAVFNTAAITEGQTVVVIGCGGVGLSAVQAARIAEASVIVAVDTQTAKLDAARELGATHTATPGGDLVEQIRAACGGRLADVALVTVGSTAATGSAFALIAPGGAVVLVGMAPEGETVDVDATTLASLNQRVLGSKMGTATVSADIPRLISLYQSGALKLGELVSETFDLDHINEALDAARSAESRRIVVTMSA